MSFDTLLYPLNFSKLEARNIVIHVLATAPASPVLGQMYANSSDGTLNIWDGTIWKAFGRLDQITAPTAAVSLNSQRIINLAAPTGASDAARKADVDAVAAGLSWKDSVRAASTANGALASAFANGSVLDGVTLATGDRILLKNQTAGAENGIYTVNASGAPTRATDADSAADLLQATVYVEEGTSSADTQWVNTTSPITLGTTALVWTQAGSGSATAGAGMTQTGQTLDVVAADGSITVAADSVTVGLVPVAKGGTNATTVAAAKTSLGYVGRYAVDIGDGAATSYVVTHNLGTRDVQVVVRRRTTPWETVGVRVEYTSINSVTLLFAVAPTAAQFRAIVLG